MWSKIARQSQAMISLAMRSNLSIADRVVNRKTATFAAQT